VARSNEEKGIQMSKHVVNVNGEDYTIPESDIWRKPGCQKEIITHDGVRKLMVRAGITVERTEPVVMPLAERKSRTRLTHTAISWHHSPRPTVLSGNPVRAVLGNWGSYLYTAFPSR
jgi:hypothetical protein